MVVFGNQKYACISCIRGHRSSSCDHRQRILSQVRRPGRRSHAEMKSRYVLVWKESQPESKVPSQYKLVRVPDDGTSSPNINPDDSKEKSDADDTGEEVVVTEKYVFVHVGDNLFRRESKPNYVEQKERSSSGCCSTPSSLSSSETEDAFQNVKPQRVAKRVATSDAPAVSRLSSTYRQPMRSCHSESQMTSVTSHHLMSERHASSAQAQHRLHPEVSEILNQVTSTPSPYAEEDKIVPLQRHSHPHIDFQVRQSPCQQDQHQHQFQQQQASDLGSLQTKMPSQSHESFSKVPPLTQQKQLSRNINDSQAISGRQDHGSDTQQEHHNHNHHHQRHQQQSTHHEQEQHEPYRNVELKQEVPDLNTDSDDLFSSNTAPMVIGPMQFQGDAENCRTNILNELGLSEQEASEIWPSSDQHGQADFSYAAQCVSPGQCQCGEGCQCPDCYEHRRGHHNAFNRPI